MLVPIASGAGCPNVLEGIAPAACQRDNMLNMPTRAQPFQTHITAPLIAFIHLLASVWLAWDGAPLGSVTAGGLLLTLRLGLSLKLLGLSD